jgi:hypothetical protein
MCTHVPPCPSANAPDRDAARSVASHPEQGWSLLCNGVVFFDDAGELLPDGRAIAAPCPALPTRTSRHNRWHVHSTNHGTATMPPPTPRAAASPLLPAPRKPADGTPSAA